MDTQERIKKANKTYCDKCDEEGMEVCSWEEMPGWQAYLKGEITEEELCDKAKEELANLDKAFGKYLRDDESKSEDEQPADDPSGGKRKVANKIYRKACVDSGLSLCFFNNFATWQQFVHGEIGENEFYDKAREEIHKSKNE